MANETLVTPQDGVVPCTQPVSVASLPIGVALYIDADNQSSQSAKALVETLRSVIGASVVQATIAGNANGKATMSWAAALREEIRDLAIECIVVPCRKDAADAALIMALGADLADHRLAGTRVVVVSRDALLHAAAERAKELGCAVCLVYTDCEIPTARHPTLATLLLPAIPGRSVSAEAPPAATVAPLVPKPPTDIPSLVERVRALCKLQPGGGYLATDVGSALSRLGYKNPAERQRVIAGFPGLREKGGHPTKVLVF